MKHTKSAFTAIVAFLLLLSQNGFSGNGVPALLPFQGRATDANGNPINYPVEVRFRIYPPSGNCYLYEEVQNVTPNSYGIFSVILGTGVTQPPLNSLSDVFNNDASTAMNDSCSQPYNSAVNDWRRLEMVVDGVSLGMQTIGSSAFALNAQLLQGKSPSDFILKSSNVTQANLENLVGGGDASGLHNHDGRYIRVDGSNSFSGNVSTSGNIIASSTTGMVGIGTTSPVADIHITKTSPVVRLEATPGAAGLPALDFYSGTNRRAKIEVSEATNGIKFYSGNSQAMEIDSSGNLLLNASLKITGTTGLGKYTTSQESALIVALGALGSVATGTLWVNSTNNTLRFWDGSQALTVMSGNSVAITPDQITNAAGKYFSYKPNGVACSDQQILTWDNTNSRWICGAVAVNKAGDTMTGPLVLSADPLVNLGAATKQYVDTKLLSQAAPAAPGVGQNGQALRWNNGSSTWEYYTPNSGAVTSVGASAPLSSSGGATPSISISQATTSTDGYLSSTDWNSFNNKLGTLSSFGGDVSGNYNSTSVDKIKGVAVTPGAYAAGQALRYDGTQWVNTILNFADLGGKPTSLSGYGITDAVNKTGDTMTGLLVLSADPSANLGAATKQYVDSALSSSGSNFIRKDGTVAFTGNQSMGANRLTNVSDPTSAQDAATKNYSDTKLLSQTAPAAPGVGQNGQALRWNNGLSTWEYFTPNSGSVTSVGASAPLSSSGGATPSISISQATTSTDGYLSSTDWNTFNNKLGTSSSFSGDVSGNYNSTSVDKIKGKAITPGSYASGQTLRYDGTQWVNATLDFADLSNKPTTLSGYGITDSLSTTLANGKILVGNGSNVATAVTVSGDASISNAGVLSLSTTGVSAGTYSKVTVDTSGRVTAGANIASSDVTTALGYTPLNKAGDSMSGTLGLVQLASDPNTAGWNGTQKGYTWFNTTSNQVKYWDGSSIQALGISGAGLTSLNGQTGSTQTFASPGTSGTAPSWSSAGNSHTLNIPMANTASVTAGLISKTEYDTFNTKLGTSTSFSGDVSGNYNSTSVDKIKGKAVTPSAYVSGQTLRFDGTQWINATLDFTDLSNRPTTLSGYGITDSVNKTGDTMTGLLVLSADPSANLGAATKQYVDSALSSSGSNFIRKDGTVAFTGNQSMGANRLTNVSDPTSAQDAATKNYADTKLLSQAAPTAPGVGQNGQALRWNNGLSAWEYFTPNSGAVTSVSASAPLSSSGGTTPSISISQATTATNGYLSSTDWNTFNNKLGTSSSFSGDVSGNFNSTSVDKIKGIAVTPGAYASGQTLRYDGTQWVNAVLNFADLGSKPTTLSGYGITDGLSNTLANGKVLIGNGSNIATAVTVTGDASISNAGVLNLSSTGVGAGTYSKVTVDITGRVTTATNIASGDVTTALGYTPLNKAGDSMSGTLGLVQLASDPNTTGWNGTQKGYTWFNTTSNQVKYWDGSAIQALGISGAGLTSLNGQTGSTQTFASPGTSGTAPSWSSAGNSHTLNIPMANTASVTAGLISKTEYDTFNTKLGTSTSFSGDVSGNYNSTSVDKIKGVAVTPGAYAAGQTLRYDGTQWINAVLSFADLGSKPTTLSGYGITDAVNKTGDTMT
ncbi:MAG: beta strand repeat-containing protein, partial [Bdellovibrio sp.]